MRVAPRLAVLAAALTAGAPPLLPTLAAQTAAAPGAPAAVDGHWARLASPLAGGAVRFSLDQPGYAAVFAVVPGEAVQLVYPRSAREAGTRFAAGTHTRATRRGALSARLVGRDDRAPATQYLFLVASTRPLRLAEPLRWPEGEFTFSRRVGGELLDPRSPDVDRTLEILFDAVVVDVNAVDTDLIAYYPDVRYRRSGRTVALSAFRCYDGRVVYAPATLGNGFVRDEWYGVDLTSHRSVGRDCYLGYFAAPPGGTPIAAEPARPGSGGSGRLGPESVRAYDARPNRPLTAERIEPAAPGGSPAPASGFERMAPAPEAGLRRSPESMGVPTPRATPHIPETRMDARPAEPAREPAREARSEPAEPSRPEPRVEVRPEPRTEPRTEPRSEPRSEPSAGRPGGPEPLRTTGDEPGTSSR